MQVKANKIRIGKKFTFAEIGEVTIPEDGIIEVSETLGKSLVANLGFELVEKGTKTPTPPEDGDDEEEEGEEDAASELKDLKKTELVDLAKEAGLPEEEWADLNKEPLVEYLTEKLK